MCRRGLRNRMGEVQVLKNNRLVGESRKGLVGNPKSIAGRIWRIRPANG